MISKENANPNKQYLSYVDPKKRKKRDMVCETFSNCFTEGRQEVAESQRSGKSRGAG